MSVTSRRQHKRYGSENVPNFLETFQIITKTSVQVIRHSLGIFTRFKVLLAIQKPDGDFKLRWILDDRDHAFDFVIREFTGTFVQIDFGFFTAHDRKSTTTTWNGSQSNPSFSATINIGIQNTKNMLEIWSNNKTLSYMGVTSIHPSLRDNIVTHIIAMIQHNALAWQRNRMT